MKVLTIFCLSLAGLFFKVDKAYAAERAIAARDTAIYGDVDSGKFNAKTGITTLMIGGASNGDFFKIIIRPQARKGFHFPPEEYFAGRNVCVKGNLVERYPERVIVVSDPSQLQLVLSDNTSQGLH